MKNLDFLIKNLDLCIKTETLIKICTHMQSFSSYEGEIIVEEGDTDRDLFILERGRAEAYVGTLIEPVEFLPEGSFFGEALFFLQVMS